MRYSKILLSCALAILVTYAVSCGGLSSNGEEYSGPFPVSSINEDTAYTIEFDANAFPPIMPGDKVHGGGSYSSWQKESCLNCHEDGINEAPKVVHEGMAVLLLDSKCRTCHTSQEAID